ncbi:MAG: hypothetical protein ACKVP7_16825 [Hyphomicrobiaceae bacterium]
MAPRPTPPPAAAPAPAVPVPAAPATAAAVAPRPVIGSGRDNLQRIGGINGEVEKLLNVQGVTRYSQIAHWGKPDVERFDRLLGYQGRIQRENWIEQAQILAKNGDTAFSREYDRRAQEAAKDAGKESAKPEETPRPTRLSDAIRDNQVKVDDGRPRSNDLSSLRSVRSEAFRPGDAAAAAAGTGAPRAARSGTPDDLKRIRGIGVLIEKKLNSMGITSYSQIANWSAPDIDRVSQVLDFKGRIERENWVEQARILDAGGQTEFSRRAERGDFEPSR